MSNLEGSNLEGSNLKGSNLKNSNLEGYLHGVTDVKIAKSGKCSFFNAVLQTSETGFEELVCYSPDKRKILKEYEEQNMAVKFCDLQFSPSKRRLDSDDLIIAPKTKILRSHVDFHSSDPKNVITDLKEVETLNVFAVVNVLVKIMRIGELETIVVRNKPELKQEMSISDKTGSLNLTV